LEELAEVEVNSENPGHPIVAARLPGHASGWRAGAPGKETIRLLFERPQPLEHWSGSGCPASSSSTSSAHRNM